MQSQAASTVSDRDLMRALIDQQTKEFESEHGAVQTQDIIKKSDSGGVWVKPAVPVAEKKKQLSALNKRVIDGYATAKCTETFAAELGITLEALRGRAKRFGVVRGQDGHPRLLKKAKRKDRVKRLMLAGYSVKEITEKTGHAARTISQDHSEIKKELGLKHTKQRSHKPKCCAVLYRKTGKIIKQFELR